MIIDNCVQGTPEWFAARLGIPTASGFSKIVTGLGAISGQLDDYALQLATERITKRPGEFFETFWMRRGKELEPKAREQYAWDTGHRVEQVGLCFANEQKLFSCSPDALVEDKDAGVGGWECKCLKPDNHARILIRGDMPNEYKAQVQGSMFVTGFDWWDFYSYCPGMKPFLKRIRRDDEYCDRIKIGLERILERVDFFTNLLQEI